MHRVEFPLKDQQWDSFKRFYTIVSGFDHFKTSIMTDDGQFVWMVAEPRPEQRNELYLNGQKLGLRMVATGDKAADRYTFMTPGGDKIPITHLTRKGMQWLLVDEEMGTAHSTTGFGSPKPVDYDTYKRNEYVPAWCRKFARVYIGGPGCVPIGQPVVYHPTNQFTREQKGHIDGLIASSKMWLELASADPDQQPGLPTSARASLFAVDQLQALDVIDYDFASLPPDFRVRLARKGVETGFSTKVLPYLTI